jgi:hypothetical protein
MNITADQDLRAMADLYAKRDLRRLGVVAAEVAGQKPQSKEAWRYVGISRLLSKAGGIPELQRAAMLGDDEAVLWLNVLSEFSFYSPGSVDPSECIMQVELSKLRRTAYMDYPLEVHIETQAICNAKCTFCPYPTMDRQGDKMSDGLIEKIIRDLKEIPAQLPFVIAPFKVNDPFLDVRIFWVCEQINHHLPNAKLRLFTNGSPLTEKIVERLAAVRNLEHLWISLNETEKDAYEKLMALPFSRTLERLDSLHKRVAAGYPHPVVVSRVVDGSARDEEFRKFLAERYPLFKCFMQSRENWTGQVDATVTRKTVRPTACARWYEVSIMASGKVALCCQDGEGKHVIGDVNKQSVLEVYNSRNYRKLRQHTFSRVAAAAPCDTCAT